MLSCPDKQSTINGCFQKYEYPKKDGLYLMEKPIKTDDFGVPPI